MKFPKLNIDAIFDSAYENNDLLEELINLDYFCLLRGRLNSHVTDGDEIVVHIQFDNRSQLIEIFNLLKCPLRILEENEPRFDRPMPAEEAAKLPTPIKQFNDIVQPYKIEILDISCFAIVHDNYISISVTNQNDKKWFIINLKQILDAKKIESYLRQNGLDKLITLEYQKEYGRYINQYHYPELFN